MIGHYLLSLPPEAEHDVLTGILEPGSYGTETKRCLVGWAADLTTSRDLREVQGLNYRRFCNPQPWLGREEVEQRFDALCYRFGVERVANAIRDRILANQARRTLSQAVVSV